MREDIKFMGYKYCLPPMDMIGVRVPTRNSQNLLCITLVRSSKIVPLQQTDFVVILLSLESKLLHLAKVWCCLKFNMTRFTESVIFCFLVCAYYICVCYWSVGSLLSTLVNKNYHRHHHRLRFNYSAGKKKNCQNYD